MITCVVYIDIEPENLDEIEDILSSAGLDYEIVKILV